MLGQISFNVKKLLGRDRNDWPVDVEKHLVYDGDRVETVSDRGRRVKDPESGDPVYEFLNEDDQTISIPRKYLRQGQDGNKVLDVMKIHTEEGPMFSPIERKVTVEADDVKDLETGDVDMDFVIEFSRFIQVGKKELERHYEITKTNDQEWYKAPNVWIVAGIGGMGFFYFLSGLGAQKVLEIANNTGAENLIPLALVSGETLRQKISSFL